MNQNITDASNYIRTLLAEKKQGTVHSVYRKTINLSFDGQLAALQAADAPLSPISLRTNLTAAELEQLPVSAGDPVISTPEGLTISSSCFFSLAHVRNWDAVLDTVLTEDRLTLLFQQLLAVLCLRDAGSFELLFANPARAGEIPYLAAAKRTLEKTTKALTDNSWQTAAGALRALLGLGLGLTPGGDDFLCGVLAGLVFCDLSGHPFTTALKQEIAAHLADTNAVSAAFLHCALHGQFSQAVNTLSMLTDSSEIFRSFSEIGHSSGTDTLCGIAFLLENRRLFLS